MQNAFEILIEDLGKHLGISLEAEPNQTCSLMIDEKVTLMLEMDKNEENLRMVSFFCLVPPGKFREKVLAGALKANDKNIKQGILGFSDATNEIALYDTISVDGLDTVKLSDQLARWIEHIFLWKEAIEAGHASPDQVEPNQAPKPFGLR